MLLMWMGATGIVQQCNPHRSSMLQHVSWHETMINFTFYTVFYILELARVERNVLGSFFMSAPSILLLCRRVCAIKSTRTSIVNRSAFQILAKRGTAPRGQAVALRSCS